MDVHFTAEEETRLAQLAIKAGTDAEKLVRDTMLRLIEDDVSSPRVAPELPLWDLGAIGSMHRCDLYDDVR